MINCFALLFLSTPEEYKTEGGRWSIAGQSSNSEETKSPPPGTASAI